MQRRATAVYVALFLVIGAAAFGLITTAEEPGVNFENPDHELSEGDQFEVEGQTYNVTSLDVSTEGGEHGEPERTVYSAEITWTVEDATITEEWANESTVEIGDTEWQVQIEGGDDPTLRLVEVIDQQAILEEDQNADNSTVEIDGIEYVVIRDEPSETADGGNETGGDGGNETDGDAGNESDGDAGNETDDAGNESDGDAGNETEGNQTDGGENVSEARLVPAADYFPEPRTVTLEQGETFDREGNETTVENVTESGATVAWQADQTNSESFESEENVTLGDQEFLAYFDTTEDEENPTLVLTQDFQDYQAQLDKGEQHQKRINGLWGAIVLSGLSIVLLVGFAFLPSRY